MGGKKQGKQMNEAKNNSHAEGKYDGMLRKKIKTNNNDGQYVNPNPEKQDEQPRAGLFKQDKKRENLKESSNEISRSLRRVNTKSGPSNN